MTDTTAPASDASRGASEDEGWVTDTTVARQWLPETAAAESSDEDDGWVTDTTAPASDAVWGWGEDDGWVTDTTVARQWPPETAAAWDARFPRNLGRTPRLPRHFQPESFGCALSPIIHVRGAGAGGNACGWPPDLR